MLNGLSYKDRSKMPKKIVIYHKFEKTMQQFTIFFEEIRTL